MNRQACVLLAVLGLAAAGWSQGAGPIVLYTFVDAEEGDIPDVSDDGEPLDLVSDVADGTFSWGALDDDAALAKSACLQSMDPATKINEAIRDSGQFTVEAWLSTDTLEQGGPARIVTLSEGTASTRNFTLGQQDGSYVVRLRLAPPGGEFAVTEYSTADGAVSLDAPRQHVVVTYGMCPTCGTASLRMVVDGETLLQESLTGDLRSWDPSLLLTLGNESTRDRQWAGTLWKLAIYDRILTRDEILASFGAED